MSRMLPDIFLTDVGGAMFGPKDKLTLPLHVQVKQSADFHCFAGFVLARIIIKWSLSTVTKDS